MTKLERYSFDGVAELQKRCIAVEWVKAADADAIARELATTKEALARTGAALVAHLKQCRQCHKVINAALAEDEGFTPEGDIL
jgi:hypothetical protein